MGGRIVKFDDSAHQAAETLLPWLVNGTLGDAERTVLEQHVRDCVRCQRELKLLRAVQDAYVGRESAPDAAPSYAKLCQRLDAAESHWHWHRLRDLLAVWRQIQPWTQWALAAQMMVILVLGAVLMSAGTPTTTLYQTLGAPAATQHAPGSLVVVFDPKTPEAELQRIVRRSGGRIVDGPSEAHAYVLEFPAGQQAAALSLLKAEHAVVLAERLDSGSGR